MPPYKTSPLQRRAYSGCVRLREWGLGSFLTARQHTVGRESLHQPTLERRSTLCHLTGALLVHETSLPVKNLRRKINEALIRSNRCELLIGAYYPQLTENVL